MRRGRIYSAFFVLLRAPIKRTNCMNYVKLDVFCPKLRNVVIYRYSDEANTAKECNVVTLYHDIYTYLYIHMHIGIYIYNIIFIIFIFVIMLQRGLSPIKLNRESVTAKRNTQLQTIQPNKHAQNQQQQAKKTRPTTQPYRAKVSHPTLED